MTGRFAEYSLGAAASSPNKEYIYAGSSLLATIQGTTTTYHHPDHLSVRLDTDSSGNVVGQQGHYPFGESWYASGTTTKWQFTGYERDTESANDYATARSYVNRLGRFSSADPFAGSTFDPQSLNRYAYVENDATDLSDPLGLLVPCTVDGQRMLCDGGLFGLLIGNDEWIRSGGPGEPDEIGFAYVDCGTLGTLPAEACADYLSGGGVSNAIKAAINKARLLLSNSNCAEFLKKVLKNLGSAPNLDDFLQNFDRLNIGLAPSPDLDRPWPGTVAHTVYGTGDVHVDQPFASNLAPTLLHETFHSEYLGVADIGLAKAVAGATGQDVPKTAQASERAASKFSSREFDKNCDPNKVKNP
jgi:RHS repeat-associated protein